jgi:hypothetical protein
MAEAEPPQQPPPQSWARAILRNPIKYLFFGLIWAVVLAIVWCLSFVLYPIQLAFGIRAYRNPRYNLKLWPRYLLISMLVLSTLEMGLLGAQLWWAYRAGSVEALHLSIFKWWQYSKNILVLCIFVAEILELKLYTGYLDSWIDRTKERNPADEAEKGLMEKDVSLEKGAEEGKGDNCTLEKTATSVVEEKEVEEKVGSCTPDETGHRGR